MTPMLYMTDWNSSVGHVWFFKPKPQETKTIAEKSIRKQSIISTKSKIMSELINSEICFYNVY